VLCLVSRSERFFHNPVSTMSSFYSRDLPEVNENIRVWWVKLAVTSLNPPLGGEIDLAVLGRAAHDLGENLFSALGLDC
jgi:hypothetical protein